MTETGSENFHQKQKGMVGGELGLRDNGENRVFSKDVGNSGRSNDHQMGLKMRNMRQNVETKYREGLQNLFQAISSMHPLTHDQQQEIYQEIFIQSSPKNLPNNNKASSQDLTLQIVTKTIEGVNNLINAMTIKQHYSLSHLFSTVIDKNEQGLDNMSKAFSELTIEQDLYSLGDVRKNQQSNINDKKYQNEFMSEDLAQKNAFDDDANVQIKEEREEKKVSPQNHRNISIDKRSEVSEEFNLDLTLKTKNNFNSVIKQEELMYSQNSQNGYLSQIKVKHKNDSNETIFQMTDKTENDQHYGKQQMSEQKDDGRKINFEVDNKYSNIEFVTPIKKEAESGRYEETVIPDSLSNFNINEEELGDQDDDKLMESADLRNYQESKNKNFIKKRVQTEAYEKKTQKINRKQFHRINPHSSKSKLHTQSNSNIFSTEISSYQSRLAKIREAKELKKKKLELQLAKINNEIKAIKNKEEEHSPKNCNNNFASRLDISNDNEAQKRAEKFVKNLRSQKRSRNNAKIGEIKNLDRHINDYMDQLHRLRAQNEDKYKQKKKLEILERMKQNQMRKMNEKKKKEESQSFVLQLKDGVKSQHKNTVLQHNLPSRRSPTRNLETQQKQQLSEVSMTPELTQKKAYLNKIRSFSRKKQNKDLYEQALG